MDFFVVYTYLEMLICILALFSSVHFFYIIVHATILQDTSRPFILLFSVSLFVLALSHGLRTAEVILGVRPEDPEFGGFTTRHYVWNLLHEFSFALHTLSLFIFAAERYITAKFSILPSLRNKVLAIILAVVISCLSMCYAQLVLFVSFSVIAVTCMNAVDCAALLILVLSSKFSIQHYRITAGIVSLETRFQISDVYSWTKTITPIASLSFLVKFVYVVVIWLLKTVSGGVEHQISVSQYYQTVMDTFTIFLPFLISSNDRRLKNWNLRNHRVKPQQIHVKTLDGRAIHTRDTFNAHFDFLTNHWK